MMPYSPWMLRFDAPYKSLGVTVSLSHTSQSEELSWTGWADGDIDEFDCASGHEEEYGPALSKTQHIHS